MKSTTHKTPVTAFSLAPRPAAANPAPALLGAALTPPPSLGAAAPAQAAPEAAQSASTASAETPPAKAPQVRCKNPACAQMIWVRRGKHQDYCSAACRATATLDQSPLPEGACQGCRRPLPEAKRGKRYCGNSCRARASERRVSETLASASIVGWQKAFETSRRENDALILANKLLMEKLQASTGRG